MHVGILIDSITVVPPAPRRPPRRNGGRVDEWARGARAAACGGRRMVKWMGDEVRVNYAVPLWCACHESFGVSKYLPDATPPADAMTTSALHTACDLARS